MDPADQMDRVYEGIVFWADAVIVASPIRGGSASSLYFKMIERMNCIQNQVTGRAHRGESTRSHRPRSGGQDRAGGQEGSQDGHRRARMTGKT